VTSGQGFYDLKFASAGERGFRFTTHPGPKELELVFTYPDATVVRLTLQGTGAAQERSALARGATPAPLRITSIRVGDEQFALRSREAPAESAPVHVETAKPDLDDAAVPRFPPHRQTTGVDDGPTTGL
jgi:hypothetical protein